MGEAVPGRLAWTPGGLGMRVVVRLMKRGQRRKVGHEYAAHDVGIQRAPWARCKI